MLISSALATGKKNATQELFYFQGRHALVRVGEDFCEALIGLKCFQIFPFLLKRSKSKEILDFRE